MWRLWAGLGWIAMLTPATASPCYGRPANGRLEQGVQLPAQGANFSAYSVLGAAAVHSAVREIVLEGYAAAAPSTRYVYGETGLAIGGPMRPHKTQQAGVSVDFMASASRA